MKLSLQAGNPYHLGARFDGEGTNFAVFSAHAARIELCIFSADGKTELTRCALPERSGSIWHGYAPDVKPGTLYGYRAYGKYAPEQGHRFNPNKLLLDPYTREVKGQWADNHPALLGYDATVQHAGDLSYSLLDSAPYVAKSVVSDPELFTALEQLPRRGWSDTLIYEAHVKGLTQQHPDVPDTLKGTYEGLATDAVIEHLQKLGITTIELLPVHHFLDEGFLLQKGLSNYWGYNSIGFFTPEPRYYGPGGLLGFRQMVEKYHQAGIEVVLDVVYNHTAEGDQRGPTLCYRGLDNASYYRLVQDQPRYYINDTGCGNTLNMAHPYVLRMVMDSLRFWVQCMGIDGFRFDLATVLGREHHGFDPWGGFFDAIRQDPVLAGVKLIAEPWDIGPGGYRLGEFPPEFAEWNDTYRDNVRRYWRGDEYSAQSLSSGLLGSASSFDKAGRRSWSSVNLLTSHDGFTLADVTRYNERHNLANQEEGKDGHSANYSDNGGVEGETDDTDIQQKRSRRQRNMLATLFLSQGTPMLLAGDELGNSQQGNNNAYCQDNPISWIDWVNKDEQLIEFVADLSHFRKVFGGVRQTRFLHGQERGYDGNPDVMWTDFNGGPVAWDDPQLAGFCLTLRCSAEAAVYERGHGLAFIAFNRNEEAVEVILPEVSPEQYWVKRIDTGIAHQDREIHFLNSKVITVAGQSVVALTRTMLPLKPLKPD
ncbi:MAG: glycogen debranching protein GlgX [Thiolinea sp.]